jgi:hypothetical protein
MGLYHTVKQRALWEWGILIIYLLLFALWLIYSGPHVRH